MSTKSTKKVSSSETVMQSTGMTPTKVTKSSVSYSRSGSSTPGSGRAGSHARTPSPARLTRMQEKEELIDLNDRLAKYIDRVRFLETENNRLVYKIQDSEEIITREVTSIKSLYESELDEARRLLDVSAKENAKLKLDLKTVRTEYDECKNRCAVKDHDLKDAEKIRKNLENQIIELQMKLSETEKRNAPLEKDLASLKKEVSSLKDQLRTAKKQLEEETILRIDLANRVQSMKEDLNLSKQVHEQELNETRSRMSTTFEEIDGRVQEEYGEKLHAALTQMRQEHEDKVHIAREEVIAMYDMKLQDMEAQVQASSEVATRARAELKVTLKKSEEKDGESASLKLKISSLETRIQELEDQLQRLRADQEIMLAVKDEEIIRLKKINQDQMLEYSDLLDVKLKLDMELAAYRKMLEGEEARLNLSMESESSYHQTPGRGYKRKRGEYTTYSHASREFARSGSSKDIVEIQDVDAEDGGFVKLYNKGNEDFSLSGWQLKHTAGAGETTYKFHRSVVIKPGATITVHSATTKVTHNPPSDLVMKGQKWFLADQMSTVLLNPSGEEMATLQMSRSSASSFQQYGSIERGREATENAKCVVM